MACHLAGVPTAVATCGTSFGDEHARVLRRFLHDHEEFRGEVIFTFDGDAAGQKAATARLRRRPELRLPDLRRRRADRAGPVRPAHPAGRRRRARAGRPAGAALPLRAQQRRRQVRPRPRRRPRRRGPRGRPAGVLDPRQVQGRGLLARARRAWSASTSSTRARRYGGRRRPAPPATTARPQLPRPRPRRSPPDPRCRTPASRGSPSSARRSSWCSSTPTAVGRDAADLGANDFTHPTFRAVWELIEKNGGPAAADAGWAGRIHRSPPTRSSSAVSSLGVEPLKTAKEPDPAFVTAPRLPAPGAHHAAADRRGQVAAPAHQPGRPGCATTTGCSASWSPSSSTAVRCVSGRWGRPSDPLPKRPPVEVAAGERVLAWTEPRPARCSPAPVRRSTSRHPAGLGGRRGRRLGPRHRAVPGRRGGPLGRAASVHRYAITEPRRFLELVRERVTASVVLVRARADRGTPRRTRDRPAGAGGGPAAALGLRVRRGDRPRRPHRAAGRRGRPGGPTRRSG